MIEHRSYIVAEIPEPVRSQIQALRAELNPHPVSLPVEITLAGSSGVGPIPAGTDLADVTSQLDRILPIIAPFHVRFSAIRKFPNTALFYLEPFDRMPFDGIHQILRTSGILFSEIQWPYNPHCTLRGGKPLDAEAETALLALPFPEEEFVINTVSVYQLDDVSHDCRLLYQRVL